MNADLLTLLFLGPNDMVFGEDGGYLPHEAYAPLPTCIRLKNPKRFQRLQVPVKTSTGEVGFNTMLQFGDFDFIAGGTVEFVHHGGFRLSWLDEESQMNYLKTYLNFIDSKKVARAQAAGLHIPTGPVRVKS